eukprot:c16977_g1_i1 orf=2-202(-)
MGFLAPAIHGCHFCTFKSILLSLQLGALLLHPPPAALAQQSALDQLYGFCNTGVFSSNDSFAQNLNS